MSRGSRRTIRALAAMMLVALALPAGARAAAPRRPEARPLTLSAPRAVRPAVGVPRLLRTPGLSTRYRALPRAGVRDTGPAGTTAPDAGPGPAWRALRAARRGAQASRAASVSARMRLATSRKNRRIASQRD